MQYRSATILPSASLSAVIASWHLFILIRRAVLIKREGRQGQNCWGGGRKWKRRAIMWWSWPQGEALLSWWCKWFHLPTGTDLWNFLHVVKAHGWLRGHMLSFCRCPFGCIVFGQSIETPALLGGRLQIGLLRSQDGGPSRTKLLGAGGDTSSHNRVSELREREAHSYVLIAQVLTWALIVCLVIFDCVLVMIHENYS